jgi:acyl-CoA reductase-like NAD-dependent aldehyde dehydrogenase
MDAHSAQGRDYASAHEAMQILGVRAQTLYAYVSRGWIRSLAQKGLKQRLYLRDDILRVSIRSSARAGHGAAAASAMKDGFFFEATVFADMKQTMRLAKEEVFGPVMSVFKWGDEEQMWQDVNSVDFGLTGSIWTQNINTAHRAAQRIYTGYVWINNASQHFVGAPFGGVKQSGIGREECFAELLEFTYTKNVNLKLG